MRHALTGTGYRDGVRGRIAITALLSGLAFMGAIAPAARSESRAWTQRALDLQYELASDVGLRNTPWVYTHNSYNSVAEMGATLSTRDPNHSLKILDQLDEGVRHLEIDTHLFLSPQDPRVGPRGPVVCHARGESEGHAGCSAEKPLVVVLREIRGWLDRHRDQVLFLYLESHLESPAGYAAGADSVEEALGSLVYRPPSRGRKCDELPLDLTRDQIRAAGKRVLLVGPCGEGPRWPSLVHSEARRKTGDENAAFRAFPSCGPDFTRAQYDSYLIRYYEDGTQLTRATKGGGTDPVTAPLAASMIRCGVDLIGLDFLTKADPRLEALVWSWAPGEPGSDGSCSVQRADGRWEARVCTQLHRVACRTAAGDWVVPAGRVRAAVASRKCARASVRNGVPRTGYEAQLLRRAALRAGASTVWLGQRRRPGGRWDPFERKGCGPSLTRAKRRWPVRRGVARFVVRLRFACTGEPLARRFVVRGGLRPVRARTGRRVRVRVGAGVRRLRLRYAYAGKRRAATVLLRRR